MARACYEFLFHGVRVRESSKLKNKELARKVETARRNQMALGAGGVPDDPKVILLVDAADSYLLEREPHWSTKTQEMHTNSLVHLKSSHFCKLLLQEVKAEHISRYQRLRLKEKASPKSVNLEVELLRLILKKHKR